MDLIPVSLYFLWALSFVDTILFMSTGYFMKWLKGLLKYEPGIFSTRGQGVSDPVV